MEEYRTYAHDRTILDIRYYNTDGVPDVGGEKDTAEREKSRLYADLGELSERGAVGFFFLTPEYFIVARNQWSSFSSFMSFFRFIPDEMRTVVITGVSPLDDPCADVELREFARKRQIVVDMARRDESATLLPEDLRTVIIDRGSEHIAYCGYVGKLDADRLTTLRELRVRKAERGFLACAFSREAVYEGKKAPGALYDRLKRLTEVLSYGHMEFPISSPERIKRLSGPVDSIVSGLSYEKELVNSMNSDGELGLHAFPQMIPLTDEEESYVSLLDASRKKMQDVVSLWNRCLSGLGLPLETSKDPTDSVLMASSSESYEEGMDVLSELGRLIGADSQVRALMAGVPMEDISA